MKIWKLLETRQQLRQQAIKTRDGDAELARINNILPQFMCQHAEALVSAYLALTQEYLPLCRALAPVLGRTSDIMAHAQQAATEGEQT